MLARLRARLGRWYRAALAGIEEAIMALIPMLGTGLLLAGTVLAAIGAGILDGCADRGMIMDLTSGTLVVKRRGARKPRAGKPPAGGAGQSGD